MVPFRSNHLNRSKRKKWNSVKHIVYLNKKRFILIYKNLNNLKFYLIKILKRVQLGLYLKLILFFYFFLTIEYFYEDAYNHSRTTCIE